MIIIIDRILSEAIAVYLMGIPLIDNHTQNCLQQQTGEKKEECSNKRCQNRIDRTAQIYTMMLTASRIFIQKSLLAHICERRTGDEHTT